jgi:hypothetical protein
MPQRQSASSAATRTRRRGTAASGGFSISQYGPTTRPDRRSDFMRRCRKDPFDRFRNHPDFNFSPDNGHHDLGTRMFFQRDADLRVTTQESREAVGKKGMGCMRIGPQADMCQHRLKTDTVFPLSPVTTQVHGMPRAIDCAWTNFQILIA